MKLDDVDNAENLLRVVRQSMGNDSKTEQWVKARLKDGYSPKTIAGALKDELKSKGSKQP